MQYIYWLITFLLLVVFVTFTAANQGLVSIDFWPFEYQLSLPFALVVLASLLTGFLVGAFLMWVRFGAARARARRAEHRAAALERELVTLKRSSTSARSTAQLPGPAGSLPPASRASGSSRGR